ncbi:MAG: Holliday junction branch migration protein RuvA [Spirochaetaceae bacterium]|nr:Holliday junction branch migration protein RuvA [Spirochaetaceae bacterium]
MFNSIAGKISAKNGGTVYVLTGGVEWELQMPLSDAEEIGAEGVEARILTWLCHREDSMTLFGFASETRRETFSSLLKVEGIGPKAALKILGGISQTELERALEAGDVSRLEKVPGLGKKTAQKMILALKGRIAQSAEKQSDTLSPYPELASALVEMGYDKRAALAALEKAAAEQEAGAGKNVEERVFRKAILYLSR